MTTTATRWEIGTEFEVEVGAVAHGGHCVSRHDGRVIFVRHTLPGERVLARITEDTGGSFCRADAVRIIKAAPERVVAPCTYAAPGGCGGCDFQHVDPAQQRVFKAQVVQEQLTRIGGLSVDEVAELNVTVAELPGGTLGWRTRTRFIADEAGILGMRQHRSHNIVEVDRCEIAAQAINDSEELRMHWEPGTEVAFVAGAQELAVLAHVSQGRRSSTHRISGPDRIVENAAGRQWQVQAQGFWQVHPAAADTLAEAVLAALNPGPGERILDLYAGAGLFAVPLANAVGSGGQVVAVESERTAAADARRHLREQRWAQVVVGQVQTVLSKLELRRVDSVVLDPPRAGAGKAVVNQIAALRPHTVAYVSCDPATLARDVKQFRSHGYVVRGCQGFDAFPMTHHVECLVVLKHDGGRP